MQSCHPCTSYDNTVLHDWPEITRQVAKIQLDRRPAIVWRGLEISSASTFQTMGAKNGFAIEKYEYKTKRREE